ncbi:MAG: PIN domain-containing protein [Novosphingobium sp.]
MILVDTSIWVAHIQGKSTPLDEILGQAEVAMHPFVLGELLLNGLPKKGGFSVEAFSKYAEAPLASPREVATFIQWGKLAGTGLGYVDANLLVSARLMRGGSIMTLDNDLRDQADRFGLKFSP